jgi:hypothetical protein
VWEPMGGKGRWWERVVKRDKAEEKEGLQSRARPALEDVENKTEEEFISCEKHRALTIFELDGTE